MSIKNLWQVAREALPVFIGDSDTSDGFDQDDLLAFATVAIEADRAQREPVSNRDELEAARNLAKAALREWADEAQRGTPHWRTAAKVQRALSVMEEVTR